MKNRNIACLSVVSVLFIISLCSCSVLLKKKLPFFEKKAVITSTKLTFKPSILVDIIYTKRPQFTINENIGSHINDDKIGEIYEWLSNFNNHVCSNNKINEYKESFPTLGLKKDVIPPLMNSYIVQNNEIYKKDYPILKLKQDFYKAVNSLQKNQTVSYMINRSMFNENDDSYSPIFNLKLERNDQYIFVTISDYIIEIPSNLIN